ncbi:hypothetical protein RRG08_054447 [Elysia crispata]|uniref:Uncharacterized protein n=1 Tax=Elysia crispata TaxID=231223 RepID=A0AAE1AVT0_9GAST|nr:hypothetical protein RRG08_054447 [Elysia crispata]
MVRDIGNMVAPPGLFSLFGSDRIDIDTDVILSPNLNQKMGADAQACWRGRVRRPDDVEDVDWGGGDTRWLWTSRGKVALVVPVVVTSSARLERVLVVAVDPRGP